MLLIKYSSINNTSLECVAFPSIIRAVHCLHLIYERIENSTIQCFVKAGGFGSLALIRNHCPLLGCQSHHELGKIMESDVEVFQTTHLYILRLLLTWKRKRKFSRKFRYSSICHKGINQPAPLWPVAHRNRGPPQETAFHMHPGSPLGTNTFFRAQAKWTLLRYRKHSVKQLPNVLPIVHLTWL